MAYIYKIENIQNGKIYVGKTLSSIEKRWTQHWADSTKERCKDRPLYRAFRKYGKTNFKIEILEETPHTYLNEREKYWIEFLGSFKNGYNATQGGDGKSYLDYSLIYSHWLETKNITKTAEHFEICRETVSLICDEVGGKLTKKEKLQLAEGKTVGKFDKNTKELLEIYPSIKEAARSLGNVNKERHISEVAKGKRQSAYGFIWKIML